MAHDRSQTFSECIMLRVTPAEFSAITQAAQQQHLSRSGYVRTAVLSCGSTNVPRVQSQRADHAELLAAVRHLDRHFYSLANLIKHSDPAASALLTQLHAAARELLTRLEKSHGHIT